ncbi:helix-turn-helix domain-containing protein [Nocardia farcinica]|uniref:helix-turn-helix domain-containing protein n=1 Tax=Nocardia farcinica TaxID=37329 RepID=UPI0024584120|nr:helix-turn-helix domain-containing protein [Nocardia farcinica]
MTKTTITRPALTSAAGLSHKTRAMLRTLGTLALKLADEGVDGPARPHPTYGAAPIEQMPAVSPSRLLTIPEACEQLRLSRWSVYQLIHRRELSTLKIGRRRFVPAAEIERLIGRLAEAGGPR